MTIPALQNTKSEPFEFQNWTVYKKSIGLVGGCRTLTSRSQMQKVKSLKDQLIRASLSIPLNIAEGVSRYGSKEKLNFFRIAKGSTFECVACLDVMKSLQMIEDKQYSDMVAQYCEVGKMLSGLIRSVRERSSQFKEFRKTKAED